MRALPPIPLAKAPRQGYGGGVTTTVEAIYEGGKLVLPNPLPLPDKAHVMVTIETPATGTDAERAAWLTVSQQSLMKVWENTDDDIFNELLKK